MPRLSLLLAAFVCLSTNLPAAEDKPRPLMRDFIGMCVHTVQFKPQLYAPVTSVVRDYHPLKWDIGDDTSYATKFPMARNGVDWGKMYGGWKMDGYRIEASIQFDDIPATEWRDLPRDAAAYGKSFASFFGPSHEALVEAVEIGNEPGKYDDATYRTLFTAMAGGVREGDPKMRIATAAADLRGSSRYFRGIEVFAGLESLYDIVNIHTYADAGGWPTWRRSYPEDSAIEFLKIIRDTVKWRDEKAPGKEVWITEFGWDASTKLAPKEGDFAKWEGSTEQQQAQWIVRAYMVLARERIDRAYLYFFNDTDDAHVHGSSGLTRNFEPKKSFYAVAQLQRVLGDYRFTRAVREDANDGYIYEFENTATPPQKVWAAWRTKGVEAAMTLPKLEGAKVEKAERMADSATSPGSPKFVNQPDGTAQIDVGESPVFLWLADAPH